MVIVLGALALMAPGLGQMGFGALLSELIVILGGFMLLLGVIELVIAWGLWTGKGWAWTVALILAALGIISSIAALFSDGVYNVITLVVQVVIIYYLYLSSGFLLPDYNSGFVGKCRRGDSDVWFE